MRNALAGFSKVLQGLFFYVLILSYEKATKRIKSLDNTPTKAYNIIVKKENPHKQNKRRYIP